MHRYYLTYQFILKFERELRISASQKISRSEFQSLSVSCEQLIQQFSLAIREKDETRASKYYFVALVNLKDCQETIIKSPELWIELRPGNPGRRQFAPPMARFLDSFFHILSKNPEDKFQRRC
jgi:hypothetical protein